MSQVISLSDARKKREKASASKSQSQQNTLSEKTGLTPTDEELAILNNILVVLERARIKPFTTKSDFARMAANEIGLCASDGLITTRISENAISNVWIITQDGLAAYEELSDVFSSD